MFISTEDENMPLPLENGKALENSSPIVSNPDSKDDETSQEIPSTFTDVNVVQEDEKFQLEQMILNLEGEIASLRHKERSLDEKRREALNKILDIKGCIRVFSRVRPFSPTDKQRTHQPISVESEKIVVRSGGSRKEFEFDKVFPQESLQENVFAEVDPIIRSALDGHNVCILAYGQTGTGKTYTMEGITESPGIIPRVLQELFNLSSSDSSSSYTFSISMLEVYLGSIRDLLAPRPSSRKYTASRCNLNIQTDSKGSVEIDGLTEVEISNFTKAKWWYHKGRRVRSTSWTNVNETSSRSHCLTRISIYRYGDTLGGKAEASKLWMVDLGGSERLLKTGATGQTLDEGRAINLSLSALGDVIAALRRKKGHVPYRNSKLTQVLKDSLGDKSKVLMVVHVSPYEEDVGETTCSCTFAKRARAAECNRELSEESKKQKEKRIAELEEQMKEAEEGCTELCTQIQKADFLLSENKRLFMKKYQPLEDEETFPITPKQNVPEITVTPRNSEKGQKTNVNSSVPRFMSSTVASRIRETTAEKEIHSRPKSVRSWARSSMQISGSQSNSFERRFKAHLRTSNKRSRYSETNTMAGDIKYGDDSDIKPSILPQSKTMAPSDPKPRKPLAHHRRRMSDLL
ncbi:kinesin-like protein KIN-14U [Solanum pennellii]|uniref:Kinesin-like protein KIN-14U n=1 Tax=Solanum pennellii TaxID=28526 RepID=A0ABM1H1U4_SOLPN|nr:kinesin-like protein KIN-14U [Solanum pennellii]